MLAISYQWIDANRMILFTSICLVIGIWLFNKFWMNKLLYSSKQSIQGKTVLITGGNSGIGYETAKDLLQRGLF